MSGLYFYMTPAEIAEGRRRVFCSALICDFCGTIPHKKAPLLSRAPLYIFCLLFCFLQQHHITTEIFLFLFIYLHRFYHVVF